MISGSDKRRKTIPAESSGNEKKSAGQHTHAGSDDGCRCKEASEMSPRQLLKLMINDLAFWKKEKKGTEK